jgi:nitric oxide reductase NorE protein
MIAVSSPSRPVAARKVPGEEGIWVLLFGDMVVFGVFFSAFMVDRSKAPGVFDAARKTLHSGMGLTNTLVLLFSSLCVIVAIGAIRARAKTIARRALSVALACGLTFIALKVFEYASLLADGHGTGANHFYLYYFILTGVHLLHVCIGLVVLTLLMTQAGRTEIGPTRMAVIEGGGCFWHVVDLLWVMLFPLLYLVS